jgi:hypothetical protein
MVFVFAYLGYRVFQRITIKEVIQAWIVRSDILGMVPGTFLRTYAFISQNLRFIWLAACAFVVALLIGAAYLSGLHPGSDFRSSLAYLVGSLFSITSSRATIRQGNFDLEKSDPELLRRFGGPGNVIVEPGNVLILENLDRPSRVIAEGIHHLGRFEKIKELTTDYDSDGKALPTLEERHGYIKSTVAVTKDGIEVALLDIHYRYRLRMGQGFGDYVQRRLEQPYPVSLEGVVNMAYNRTVRWNPNDKVGEPTPWHTLINIAVEGAIADFVREHKFDELLLPIIRENDRNASQASVGQALTFEVDFGRDLINQRILSVNLRERLRNYGADLLWWDMGHLSIRNPVVAQQLLDKWGTDWDSEAMVIRARGEAERLKWRETAQAEVQAEILLSIVQSLEAVLPPSTARAADDEATRNRRREIIRNIILVKTSQLLEAITSGGRQQ